MQNDCAFCDRSQFEERIIGETDKFWIIATLGQIPKFGGYVLVVPKHHVSCVAALTHQELMRIAHPFDGILFRIGVALDREYGKNGSTIFEHGIVGQTIQHAHLHVLPVEFDMTDRVISDFRGVQGTYLRYIGSFGNLKDPVTKKDGSPYPYLLWTTPRHHIVSMVNPPAPNQYLRIVAAELLGYPERADWRTMDPELDRRLYSETVTRLKPYFL